MVSVRRFALVWLVFGAVSCGGTGPAETAPDPDSALERSPLDGEWDLVEWTEQGEPVDDEAIHLESVRMWIDGRTSMGQGPCNHYEASLEVEGAAMRIDVGFSTGAGCLDEDEMATPPPPYGGEGDELYFEALERIRAYERDGGRLVLTGADTRLVYEEIPPVPDSPLAGTTWTLSSLSWSMPDDPDGGSVMDVPTRDGEEPTLVLGHDGEFTAETGCRQLTGRWERDGDHLLFRDVAAGDGACGDPNLEDLEARQLEVFESRMELELRGNGLGLYAGQHGLVYTTPTESAGTG